MVRENEPTLLVMYVAESIRASKNESPIANNSRGWGGGGGGQSFPTMQEVRATSVDHRKVAWKSSIANTKPLTFTIILTKQSGLKSEKTLVSAWPLVRPLQDHTLTLLCFGVLCRRLQARPPHVCLSPASSASSPIGIVSYRHRLL